MRELIWRDAAVDAISSLVDTMSVSVNKDYCCGMRSMKERVILAVQEAIPAIEAMEIRHAKDICVQSKHHCEFKCSLCGAEIGVVEGGDLDGGYFNYCPNCGAKMDDIRVDGDSKNI